VRPDGQRYSFRRSGPDHHLLRYEATDSSFAGEIKVDQVGFVLYFPGIARRLAPAD
jgi:hypothetical protein